MPARKRFVLNDFCSEVLDKMVGKRSQWYTVEHGEAAYLSRRRRPKRTVCEGDGMFVSLALVLSKVASDWMSSC